MGLRYNALCTYRARQIYFNLKFKDKVLICNAAETSGLLSTRRVFSRLFSKAYSEES